MNRPVSRIMNICENITPNLASSASRPPTAIEGGSNSLCSGSSSGGLASASGGGRSDTVGNLSLAAGERVRPQQSPSEDDRKPVVWIVNQYAGSPLHGMEYRHYHLARELVARGHRVVMLSGSYSHLFTRRPRVSRPFTLQDIDGITYCWVAGPPYGRAISVGRVLNMVAFAAALEGLPTRRLPRPDAILVSSPSLFPLPVAARWARRFGARLAFEVRDIWPLTLQELGGLSAHHPLVALMRRIEDYGYRVADAVVSVLPAAREHMVARGMDPAKFRYLPNGIDLTSGPEPDADPPDEVADAVRDGVFTVGFVGTLGHANVLET